MKTNNYLLTAVTALSLFLLSIVAAAQPAKGDWMVSGNGSATYSDKTYIHHDTYPQYQDHFTVFSFNVSPDAGYFFSDRFVAGATLRFNYSYTSADENGNRFYKRSRTETSGQGGIGLFARYYIPLKNNRNQLFADLHGFYQQDLFDKTSVTDTYPDGSSYSQTYRNTDISKQGDVLGRISFGYSHFFRKHVAFDIALGYEYEYSWNTYNTDLQVNSNYLTLGAGFTFLISGNKEE